MRSSLGGVFRALVMLTCLVVVPLLALPDVSFPEWYKRIASGGWKDHWWRLTKSGSDSQATQAKQPQSSSQRDGKPSGSWLGGLPAGLGGAGSTWPGGPLAQTSQSASENPAATTANSRGNSPPSGEMPSSIADSQPRAEVAAAGGPANVAATPAPRPAREALSRAQGIIPTAFIEQSPPRCEPNDGAPGLAVSQPLAPPETTTQTTVSATPPERKSTPSHEQMARFRVVEQRLRALGAVHYLLEAWGNATEYYRFRCRMPVAGSSSAVRYFEATDSDGLAAMCKVLEEVEAWKARSL